MVMRVLPFTGITAPRFPFEKSYSALIVFYLTSGCTANRYQPDFIAAMCVDNNKNGPCATFTDSHKTFFIFRIKVWLVNRQGIVKHPFGIREGNPVFSQVTCCFCGIELEVHFERICIICIYVKPGSGTTRPPCLHREPVITRLASHPGRSAPATAPTARTAAA